MCGDSPIIKLFTYNNKYYMYDFGKNNILQTTEEIFKEMVELQKLGFKRYMEKGASKQSQELINSLLSKGYFKCFTVREISHHYSPILNILLNRFVQDLILQVTQDCNFQCRYCLYANDTHVERNHEKINMSYEIAKKSVDFLFDHCKDRNEIVIGFYGGEPFLNFELIRSVTAYANQKFQSKKIRFITTTNASLLNDEIIDFIIENHFEVSISIDGNEKYQNAHRRFRSNGKGTFDIVIKNINKIKNKNETYFLENVSFNPVVFNDESQDVVYSFFESIGVPKDNVNFNNANLNGIDYLDSPTMLFSNTKLDSAKTEVQYNTFAKKIEENSIVPEMWHPNGQCIPGVRRLYVSVDGSIYPCEKIVENKVFSIGNVNDVGIDKEKAMNILNSGKITEDECKKCWAFRFCEMCVSHCLNPEKDCLSKEAKLLHCSNQKKAIIKMMKTYIDIQDQPSLDA